MPAHDPPTHPPTHPLSILGEHTDYNEGFVFPLALDLRTFVVGRGSLLVRPPMGKVALTECKVRRREEEEEEEGWCGLLESSSSTCCAPVSAFCYIRECLALSECLGRGKEAPHTHQPPTHPLPQIISESEHGIVSFVADKVSDYPSTHPPIYPPIHSKTGLDSRRAQVGELHQGRGLGVPQR